MNKNIKIVLSAFCGMVTVTSLLAWALDVHAPPKLVWLAFSIPFLNETIRYFKEATEK